MHAQQVHPANPMARSATIGPFLFFADGRRGRLRLSRGCGWSSIITVTAFMRQAIDPADP